MASKNKQKISQQFKQLETIVDDLKNEAIDLEEGMKKMRKGLKLAVDLKKRLTALENEISQIEE